MEIAQGNTGQGLASSWQTNHTDRVGLRLPPPFDLIREHRKSPKRTAILKYETPHSSLLPWIRQLASKKDYVAVRLNEHSLVSIVCDICFIRRSYRICACYILNNDRGFDNRSKWEQISITLYATIQGETKGAVILGTSGIIERSILALFRGMWIDEPTLL